MKRWQIEQILYLNDIGKTKLALPEAHHLVGQSLQNKLPKKENIVLVSLRKGLSYLLRVL